MKKNLDVFQNGDTDIAIIRTLPIADPSVSVDRREMVRMMDAEAQRDFLLVLQKIDLG